MNHATSNGPRAILPSVNSWNAEYLDAQYHLYKADPESVSADLRQFFSGFDLAYAGLASTPPNGHAPSAPAPASSAPAAGAPAAAPRHGASTDERLHATATALIEAYRRLGHMCAAIDPFGRERPCPEALKPEGQGLSEADLDRPLNDLSSPWLAETADNAAAPTLRSLIERLDATYCSSIGVEFSHISDTEQYDWLAERMERARNRAHLSRPQKAHVLYQLHRAEIYEKFCQRRYPGVKRFSLEGGESLIPLLDRVLERGTDYDVQEIVLGMSHRGRLNVLANIVGKTYEQIFTEFEDAWPGAAELGGGDVKYHRGFSATRRLPNGKSVAVTLSSNPSHLESACPVVLGRCRAKQRLGGDHERSRCVPILIHGDAAVIGQGIVAEVYNLSQLEGYTVGGTVHVVVNNLIGFTTGQEDARSTRYCTDIAKMIEAPVLHVNGEDPEAVVYAAELALDYRMRFRRDVVIDLLGYRLHGHNETDEAAFTQPLLYDAIKQKKSVLTTYADRLRTEKVITDADFESIKESLTNELESAFAKVKQHPVDPLANPGKKLWEGIRAEFTFEPVDTAVPAATLAEVASSLGRWPEGFTPHQKLLKTLQERATCVTSGQGLDWGTGEALAFGTLLLEGTLVRLAGQDCRRGTFSHRHAALRDVNTNKLYVPLNHIRELGVPGSDMDVGATIAEGPHAGKPRQAKLCVYDSPLSEFACLGFEYGFSLASPDMLVIWEAQFGDFANGAQVVIDQYLASGEIKWKRWSGVTLLLPHGYEGQGPEHSSARLERFLTLCGNNNMIVAHPTTPAQYFHLLRRQARAPYRKPLIVMTPKSLLRLPAATSPVADFSGGAFNEILDDPMFTAPQSRARVTRVILCSGKVYYDLLKRRAECAREDVAIVRVEQIYPLHSELLGRIVRGYPNAQTVWVQEEPRNAGAWAHLAQTLDMDLPYIGRPASATPATGSPRHHFEQLDAFLTEAIGPSPKGAQTPVH